MTLGDWLLDGLLVTVLVVLALGMLRAPGLFHAVVLFICLGLLMALAWVRLAAPDVALAEAGIGAALTGVLLVDLLHKLRWGRSASRRPPPPVVSGWPARLFGSAAVLAVLALLLPTVFLLPATGTGLTPTVTAHLPDTGVTWPVTAVLLDFRSLDTLLEITALVLAVLGILSMRCTRVAGLPITAPARRDEVVEWLPRLLLPLLVIMAGYLLWLGAFTAGGAFQSGIVLAAAVVLLWLTGQRTMELLPAWLWRALLVVGVAAFLLVGGALLLLGRPLLDYPPDLATPLILLLEFAATLTIGTALATLFLGLSAPDQSPELRTLIP